MTSLDFFHQIQQKGLQQGASDLFLRSGSRAAFKIDGKVIFEPEGPILTNERLIEYLKSILSEKELTHFQQEWELNVAITVPQVARFRMNVIRHLEGISITMRYVPEVIPSFENLGLPEALKQILGFPNGLVVITGPMGSGKTTTLACLVDLINRSQQKHILTIEDPIEFIHQGDQCHIEQREVGIHTRAFYNALKSCLRSATDVILLGEMRDIETMSQAITAAETGNLVLATAHTNGAQETIDRLIDVFPSGQQNQIRQQLASSLRAVIWQSLLPKAEGKGRAAAFEVMFKNYAIANLIREQKTHQIKSILQMSSKEGMISMEDSLKSLIQKGEITIEDALNVLPPERKTDLQNSLERNNSTTD